MHNERRRGQRTGHLDQVLATHNERRRGLRPKPMPEMTHLPLHHKRPVFALFTACLIREQADVPSVFAWNPSFLLVFFFWYFWLTIQNTANRHVSNAFDLIAFFL
jgi:hypothetical protein